MDPISALLFAIALTTVGAKTAASGVSDVIAQQKGTTPPSMEKWRGRQERRKARGEKPETEPGPWRRRWRNNIEARNQKAAQKHEAKMEHLRDNGRGNVDKHKKKLERRAARREQVGTRLAEMGNSSWEATKQAAVDARDARAERKAWKENDRRDAGDAPDDGEDQEQTGPGGIAAVLPFPNRQHQPTGGTDNAGADTGPDSSGMWPADLATQGGTCLWDMGDPDGPCGEPTVGGSGHCWEHLHPFFKGEGHPSRDHPYYGVAATENDNTDDSDTTGGSAAMSTPTHSGEITDLPSAQAYVTSASDYCSQISGTFETAQSQSSATARELRDQLGHLEAAQSSLAGQGLDGEAARLASVAEHFASLASSMEQVETLLASTTDALGAAQSELDNSAKEFESQQGIAEQIQSHGDNVADNTSFYAHA